MQLCSESACSYPGRSDRQASFAYAKENTSRGLVGQPLGVPVVATDDERMCDNLSSIEEALLSAMTAVICQKSAEVILA